MIKRIMGSHWSAYVIDKDGTLVNGNIATPGAAQFLRRIQDNRAPFIIVTNTGEQSAKDVAESLHSTLGICICAEQIITARDVAIQQVHMMVADTPRTEVVAVGANPPCMFPHIDVSADIPTSCRHVIILLLTDGDVPNYYTTMCCVAEYVRRGARVVTNAADTFIPDRSSRPFSRRAGPGIFLSAVSTMASDVQMDVVVAGKHAASVTLGEMCERRLRDKGFNGNRRDILMVGDRVDTDMTFGSQMGWSTCLVECGSHSMPQDISFIGNDVVDTVTRDLTCVASNMPSPPTRAFTSLINEILLTTVSRRRLSTVRLSNSCPARLCDL